MQQDKKQRQFILILTGEKKELSLKLHQCDRFEEEKRTTKNKALIRDPNLN